MNKDTEIKMRASLNTSLNWFFSIQPAAHSLIFPRRKLSQILSPWMQASVVLIPHEEHDLGSTKSRSFQYCSYCHRRESTWRRCLLSLKKVCHLSMSQHLDKKIHTGYSTIQKDPWGFSNLKSTQRAPCL